MFLIAGLLFVVFVLPAYAVALSVRQVFCATGRDAINSLPYSDGSI